MVIEIDLSSLPPALTLVDLDDLNALSVRVSLPEHAFVSRETLLELAGGRAADNDWRCRLDAMLGYAATKGWIRDDDGAVQVHLEWSS